MYAQMSPNRKCKSSGQKIDLYEDISSKLGLIVSLEELNSQISSIVKSIIPEVTGLRLLQFTEPGISQIRSAINSQRLTLVDKNQLTQKELNALFESHSNDLQDNKKLYTVVILPIISSVKIRDYKFFLLYLRQSNVINESLKKSCGFIERHVAMALTRLDKSGNIFMSRPTSSVNQILALCGSLFDQDAGELQKKVLNFLIENTHSETGFLLLVCLDSKELLCQNRGRRLSLQICGQIIQDDAINFDAEDSGIFDYVLREKTALNLGTLSQKQLEEVEEVIRVSDQSIKAHNALCVPVRHRETEDVIAIVCLINKESGNQFTRQDEDVVQECFKYTTSVLFTTIAYQRERRLKLQTEKMLTVAKNIFSRMDNLNDLLLMIMKEARNLTQAERCSVFLVDEDSNELVAKVFDGLPTATDKHERVKLDDGTEIDHSLKKQPGEIRIPKSQGIAGHVATTGEMLNIKKAYEHPLFYRGVDDETGFKTRNILCFPIQDEAGKTVGVAQLCNKIKGHFFTKMDEEVAKAFSIYCCISITHSLMYKKVEDAQHRSRLANELMMFHMKITDEDIVWLTSCPIPEITVFLENFEAFNSIPRNVRDRESVLAVVSMFETLGLINRWRIHRRTLARFIFMVKRNYRDPPYHNWMHAFSVAHFVYICARNLPLDRQLTELELLALFVSSLCHDVDHRGTNNSFQVQSGSVLAALYSSEGSVLERHHFSQTVCILNTEGCNVFESLPQKDYIRMLDLIRDIILATDLAHHLGILSTIQTMAENGYDQSSADHHQLLLCLLMTCADLSDQTKNWRNTRAVAELIYKEFFRQGDLEKAIGNQPCEQMDRERAVVPNLQVAFLDGIVSPLYLTLGKLFPETHCITETIARNRENWIKISNKVKSGELKGNSDEIFRNRVVEDDFD